MPRKPFKIWNRSRTVRKSVVAESLKELTENGKVKLSLKVDEKVDVVLEEDGTHVEDEDYFQCLPDNTIFILLPNNESWLSRKKTDADGFDVPDTTDSVSYHSREHELCLMLCEDFHVIATFPETDLEVLINMKAKDMSQTLGKTEKFCEQLQATCQQYLDDRLQAREAAELVKLLHGVETSGGDCNKRQRTA